MNSIFNIRPTINMEEEMNKIEAIVSSKLFSVPEISQERVSFKELINEIIVFWEYRGTAFSHDEFFSIRDINVEKPYTDADIYAHLQLYYVLIKALMSNSSFDANSVTAGLYRANEQLMKDIIMHIEAILFAQSIDVVQRKGTDLYDFVKISER